MEALQDWTSPRFDDELGHLERGGVTFEFLRRNKRYRNDYEEALSSAAPTKRNRLKPSSVCANVGDHLSRLTHLTRPRWHGRSGIRGCFRQPSSLNLHRQVSTVARCSIRSLLPLQGIWQWTDFMPSSGINMAIIMSGFRRGSGSSMPSCGYRLTSITMSGSNASGGFTAGWPESRPARCRAGYAFPVTRYTG